MYKLQLLIALLVMVIAIACSPSLREVEPSKAQALGIPLQDLSEGRELYANKCSACHGLVQPESLSQAEWEAILTRMAPLAKLDSIELHKVSQYLYTQHKQ